MSAAVDQAIESLRRGGVGVVPTETVYGLGADASNELAVRRIFAIKGRPSSHPLIVHVADVAHAKALSADFPRAAEQLAAAFWPGPLTLIVRRSPRVGDAVTGGQDTVGLRVPSHPLMLEVLRSLESGVAAPSANRFGRVSPTTAQHAREELGADVDFVLDGGPCQVGVESTIVDLSGASPRLLRPGGVSVEAIEGVLGRALPLETHATDVRAPGLLASHYAPRAGLWLVTEAELGAEVQRRIASGARVVALAPALVLAEAAPALPPGVHRLEVPDDEAGFARVLYARLREADALGDVIIAVPPGSRGLGLAVRDRLQRAAAPRG